MKLVAVELSARHVVEYVPGVVARRAVRDEPFARSGRLPFIAMGSVAGSVMGPGRQVLLRQLMK